jgi:hypothetical protein
MGLFGVENAFQGLYNIVPGANAGFGFILFFVVGAIIGHFALKSEDANQSLSA